MEKKYYFRGLGLGIIVTAVIMGIALSGGRQGRMTDEEIIARAKKLGMIEDSSLLASSDNEENEAEETGEQENADAAEPETVKPPVKLDVAVAEPKPEEAPEESEETDADSSADTKTEADTESSTDTKPESDTKPSADTNEMTKQDDDTTETASKATSSASSTSSSTVKSVTIVSGDGSYTVAKKLADAGVVDSAGAFDTFLCQNGYDKKLRTGTFQIPANASGEQIARIVTGQQ